MCSWVSSRRSSRPPPRTISTCCCRPAAGGTHRAFGEAAAGQACFEEIRTRWPEATAAVTINEVALQGLQRALHSAGLRVPRDFSITGVIADRWAEDFQPPLTAADVPAEEMARIAVDL